MGHFALLPGMLAYVDTFDAGLVPCKVTDVRGPGYVTVKVTATRKGWHRGECITATANDRRATIIPRTAVHVRNGQYRIAAGQVIAYPAPGQDYPPQV